MDDQEGSHFFVSFSFEELAPDWSLESHLRSREALERIVQRPPDAVMLDIRMPELSGINCLRKLKAVLPTLPIIMLTASFETQDMLLSVLGGAFDYLVKPVLPEDVVRAVEKALVGEAFLCPWAETQVVRRLNRLAILPGVGGRLSAREQEVLACLLRGRLDKEIALELGISQRTVEGHVADLCRKLGVHHRHEVVLKFLRQA